MAFKVKYIGLITGLLLIIISFLFFARQQEVYFSMNMLGFLISLTSFLFILFSKSSNISKIIWTIIVAFFITIQQLIEPILIKGSYLIYLNKHKSDLIAVNSIVLNKPGEIYIYNDTIIDKDSLFTQAEKKSLAKLIRQLNVYMILKLDNSVYYGLWGMLDVRLGIIYWTKNEKPEKPYQKLKGKWYY